MNRRLLVNTAGSVHTPRGPTPPAWFVSGDTVDVEGATVQERFESQVRRAPDAVALEVDGHTLTYRELNDRANRLAHFLRRRGVGPDILVGISMERSFDLVAAIYGILKAGGAYVPLDPTYPLDRLHYMAGASKVQFLVTHRACEHLFRDLAGIDMLLLDESWPVIEREDSNNPEPLAVGNNLIYVIFTSGSTGQPKAAALYHRGFTNLVQWFVDEFEISSHDRALLVSSLSFDLTQKNLFATLMAGGTLHLYPPGPYDISVLSRLICEQGVTLINCTPSAFYPLVEPFQAKSASSLASLRVVFLGGEPISIARIKPWMSHSTCRAEVANTYGPTECTDICGFYRLTRNNLEQYDFVPLGRPIRNVQMAVVNSESALCTIGESGELCVGGVGVGAGYINDAEATRAKFVANELPEMTGDVIYRTGDQARWHPDGVIEFLGRLDHQVKIRGFRIELPEVERAMEAHPAVSEAIVIVKGDSTGGDPQLVGCFTTDPDRCASVVDLRCHLSAQLPAHMIPGTMEEFSTFPLSPNGKVDRTALAKLVRGRRRPATLPTAIPSIGLEGQIHAAWCRLLERDQASLDDNFFDLGGDSLLLARLHRQLESLLAREFPITDLFAHPTIRGMTKHLNNEPEANGKQRQVRERARLQRAAQAARRRSRG